MYITVNIAFKVLSGVKFWGGGTYTSIYMYVCICNNRLWNNSGLGRSGDMFPQENF